MRTPRVSRVFGDGPLSGWRRYPHVFCLYGRDGPGGWRGENHGSPSSGPLSDIDPRHLARHTWRDPQLQLERAHRHWPTASLRQSTILISPIATTARKSSQDTGYRAKPRSGRTNVESSGAHRSADPIESRARFEIVAVASPPHTLRDGDVLEALPEASGLSNVVVEVKRE